MGQKGEAERGSLRGKGRKGPWNSVGREDLARTIICSEHGWPLDGAV